MNRPLVSPFRAILIAAALLPVAGFLTLLLAPLWRAIEARTGLEAIGHSGPAGWCYGAVYCTLLAVFTVVAVMRRRRPAPRVA